MLKIHHHFFINFIVLFFISLIAALLVGYLTLKSIIIDHTEEDLKRGIDTMEAYIVKHQPDDIPTLAKRYHDLMNMRITIVDGDGDVIAESDANKEEMENHANRFEIMQSASNDYGTALRYSDTLKTDFLYVAKRIELNGERVTLRMAMSLHKIFSSFATITSRLIIIMVLFLVVVVYISYRLSARIQEDIDGVITYLEEIGNKNYKAVMKAQNFSEFLVVALQLKNLVKKLSNRDKQKRKYTAKLRLVNKQRTDILSAISHEFKNPVAAIMGYAETLHDDPDVDTRIRLKFLDKVLSNAQKIAAMLDRLSLSVKLENDDLTLHKGSFDICELIEEVAQNLNKKYKDRTIHTNCETRIVYADKTTIEMLLINLVDNAMKYSETDVIVALKNDRVEVIDRGMGISEKEIEKITSKFYRVQKNTWDNSLGLGLSIVTYILKLHNSSLDINSEPGVGSTFSFDLSMMKATQEEEK
jgi:signal transduction histidine kinase